MCNSTAKQKQNLKTKKNIYQKKKQFIDNIEEKLTLKNIVENKV